MKINTVLLILLVMFITGLQLNAQENERVRPKNMQITLSTQSNTKLNEKESISSKSQVNEVRSLLKTYSSSKDVEFIEISGSILNRLFNKSPKKKDLSGIEKIEILIVGKDTRFKEKFSKDVINEFYKKLSEGYEKLISMKRDIDEISIFLEKDEKQIVSVTNNKKEISIICLNGKINNNIIDMMLNGEIKLSD